MAEAGWARRVYGFVKVPQMGRVKTRLARDVGAVAATAFYRRVCAEVLSGLAGEPAWRLILAVDPPSAVAAPAAQWPRAAARIAQSSGDLGARMGAVFRTAPPGPVVIVGTDIPDLMPRHVRAAFKALEGADAVVGPAADGGFWLIGLRRMRGAPRLFQGVRWSTPHALADTLASLPESFRVRVLETLRDVDRGADLAALRR